MTDVLEELLVRHGYAESTQHARAGAAALLPFTRQDSWVEMAMPVATADTIGVGVCEETRGHDASGTSREERDFDCSSMVHPPTVESRPDGHSNAEGVYFGGAYTLRCYGVGAEVRLAPYSSRQINSEDAQAFGGMHTTGLELTCYALMLVAMLRRRWLLFRLRRRLAPAVVPKANATMQLR